MYEKEKPYNTSENTVEEIINKIEKWIDEEMSGWSDPRDELREIKRLVGKLKEMIVGNEAYGV